MSPKTFRPTGYWIDFTLTMESKVEGRVCTKDGALVAVVSKDDKGWTFPRMFRSGVTTPLAAAKLAAEKWCGLVHDIDQAHAAALYEVERRADALAHRERVEADRAARAADLSNRRATLPMLSVMRDEITAFDRVAGEARRVVLFGDYNNGVDIRKNRTSGWDAEVATFEAEVSWHGTTGTPQEAREYALAILRAADEAESINRAVSQPGAAS